MTFFFLQDRLKEPNVGLESVPIHEKPDEEYNYDFNVLICDHHSSCSSATTTASLGSSWFLPTSRRLSSPAISSTSSLILSPKKTVYQRSTEPCGPDGFQTKDVPHAVAHEKQVAGIPDDLWSAPPERAADHVSWDI